MKLTQERLKPIIREEIDLPYPATDKFPEAEQKIPNHCPECGSPMPVIPGASMSLREENK